MFAWFDLVRRFGCFTITDNRGKIPCILRDTLAMRYPWPSKTASADIWSAAQRLAMRQVRSFCYYLLYAQVLPIFKHQTTFAVCLLKKMLKSTETFAPWRIFSGERSEDITVNGYSSIVAQNLDKQQQQPLPHTPLRHRYQHSVIRITECLTFHFDVMFVTSLVALKEYGKLDKQKQCFVRNFNGVRLS